MRRFFGGLAVLLLGGCATAADIKPGVVRGLDAGSGYVKTTEGLALGVSGCADPAIWKAVQASAAEATVRDSTNFWRPRSLSVLDDDEAAGALRAKDDGWLNAVSYVGIYLHRVRPDLRLVEVTAFWHGRTIVLTNPWERALLENLSAKLGPCVLPSAAALQDSSGFSRFPLQRGRPLSDPDAQASPIFCRQRANSSAGLDRTRWTEEYRRCMAGY